MRAPERDRLRAVVVEGLFGSRNYTISLDQERPTVLTGLNGTGKSTVLRLVNAAARADIDALAVAPLDGITLKFNAMPDFVVRRDALKHTLTLEWGKNKEILDVSWNTELTRLPEWAQDALREMNYESTDESMRGLVRYAQTAAAYQELGDVRERVRVLLEARKPLVPPAWMEELQKQFAVLFISDQRLIVEPKSRINRFTPANRPLHHPVGQAERRSIELASAEIAARIQDADSTYARVSQDQDRTFPNAVIEAMKKAEDISRKNVSNLVNEAARKRERLRLVGLLDRTHSYEPELDSDDFDDINVRSVMATIMRATLSKLDVLDDLATRLTTYKEFLDRRYFPKSVSLNRRYGLRIELSDGSVIRPSSLSSGEQQMAVLAYEILFRTDENTVVIIDEPEISLHVLWQDTLIDDLSEMGNASKLQFLMATHSPVILANHSELERSLDELHA